MHRQAAWAITFLLFTLAASRVGATEQGAFDYTTNSGAITITRYLGTGAEVTIPESIGDLPVTTIGANAFYRNRALTSVTLPKTITLIESRPFDLAVATFAGCENLAAIKMDPLNPAYASVDGVLLDKQQTNLLACPQGKAGSYTIPASVTRITDRAFAGCGKLTGIIIPESVARMGNGAFAGCRGLTNVTIPTGVTWIGSQTFAGCGSLTNVQLPGSITRIEDGAFSDCSNLASIMIPAGVTTIGEWAFSGCGGLTQVTIPASVTSIGPCAFTGCAKLKALAVDPLNPVFASVDDVLFDKDLTTLLVCPEGKTGVYVIPGGVTRIETGAFAGCRNLSHITIPETVTSIGARAFAGCRGLVEMTIPGGVTTILGAAFEGCDGLAGVTITSTVTSIEGAAFLGCTSLASITIPNSVTNIGDTAFNGCIGLEKVTTPKGVTRIETAAFQNCSNLTTATIRGNLASLGNGPFYNCANLRGVYFEGDAPGGLVATSPFAMFNAQQATIYYLPEHAGWGPAFGGRPTAPWLPRVESASLSLAGTNQFGFTLTWASGKQVVVEACTNLANPAWSPAGTNAMADGSSFFSLPTRTDFPNQYFRLRSP